MCLVPGLLVVTVVRLLLRVDCQAPPPTGKQEFLKIDRLRQRDPITKAARPPRQGSQPAFAASRRRARPAAFRSPPRTTPLTLGIQMMSHWLPNDQKVRYAPRHPFSLSIYYRLVSLVETSLVPAGRGAQPPLEPGLRKLPIPFYGPRRHTKNFCGFFDCHPDKKSKLDQATQFFALLRQFL